ncbi:Hsp20/alpha crystallin family protein [Massilia brevitalea]|uniref:Hsp20/alpha crystallin family protein n=1 Tax=Massilia brevitalea TaxID=442526 RepID=UPI002738CB8F|nr:Hsp20 family protein [Massilia brevitalea]
MSKHLTHFEPFADLISFDPLRGFEDLFRELRHPALLRQEAAAFRLDVDETEQAYTVSAEIPGVRKEDIKVDIDGNRVAITAERKVEHEEKQGTSVRSERRWGKQYRSFVLQVPVDEGKAEAKYDNGVLKLVLPKKADAGGRRLAIA